MQKIAAIAVSLLAATAATAAVLPDAHGTAAAASGGPGMGDLMGLEGTALLDGGSLAHSSELMPGGRRSGRKLRRKQGGSGKCKARKGKGRGKGRKAKRDNATANEDDGGTRNKEIEKFTTEDFVCIAQTVTNEVTESKDAQVHAAAIADAFSTACAKGDGVKVEDFDDVFKSDDAFAFAHTMARVQLKCFSFTEAYACVSVSAAAEAWAEATADAHASAVSSAVAGCGCLTDAVTDAFTDSSVYLQLVAQAASTATATACLDGTGFVKARAYDSCVTKVYSKVFADATAEAITLGNCMSSDAISEVLAKAGAEFDAFSTCDGEASVMQAEPDVVEKEVAKAEALRASRK